MAFSQDDAVIGALDVWLGLSPCQSGDTGEYDPDHEFMDSRFTISDVDARGRGEIETVIQDFVDHVGTDLLDTVPMSSENIGASVISRHYGSGFDHIAGSDPALTEQLNEAASDLRIPDAFFYDVDGSGEEFKVSGE